MNIAERNARVESVLPMIRWTLGRLGRGSRPEDVDDHAGDAALDLVRKTPTYDPGRASYPTAARHWIVGAIRNEWTRRRRLRAKAAILSLDTDVFDDELPPIEVDHVARLSKAERARAVRAALRALPVRERSVLVARYFNDEGPMQIAKRLGCTHANVWAIERKALARLREALQ